MDFVHKTEFGINKVEAYEILIKEIIHGHRTLFSYWDFVESSWKYTDKVEKLSKRKKLNVYKPGTYGHSDKLVDWINH